MFARFLSREPQKFRSRQLLRAFAARCKRCTRQYVYKICDLDETEVSIQKFSSSKY